MPARFRYTTLRKVVKHTAIYYDPDPSDTIIAEDRQLVQVRLALMAACVGLNLMGLDVCISG